MILPKIGADIDQWLDAQIQRLAERLKGRIKYVLWYGFCAYVTNFYVPVSKHGHSFIKELNASVWLIICVSGYRTRLRDQERI